METLAFSHRGFTLLELLVVLTIAVLLLTLVPPLFQGAGSTSELKAAARQLAAGLRSARNDAVMRQREASLMLDLERHRFGVTGTPRQINLPQDIGVELFTAQSELVNEAAAGIRFFPDGSSTGGRITLTTGERAFAIDVDWLTGKVSILSPDLLD